MVQFYHRGHKGGTKFIKKKTTNLYPFTVYPIYPFFYHATSISFFHGKIVSCRHFQCETNFVSHAKFADSRSLWYFKAQTRFENVLVQKTALHAGNTSVKKIQKSKKSKNVSLKSKLAMAGIRRNRAEIVRLDSRHRENGCVLAILHSSCMRLPYSCISAESWYNSCYG